MRSKKVATAKAKTSRTTAARTKTVKAKARTTKTKKALSPSEAIMTMTTKDAWKYRTIFAFAQKSPDRTS